ncbi:hypothetical protein ZHAS_00019622 [Anopheles sinensis]|uniref:Uncharacterized protein n=1 Tax=Anopheles sinensis TaxID=74873 RepID=A0A084WMW1_ANOSI|nr:hypothetical protein ZHAS_00019622 [Anopheles sinensis]
MSDSTTSFLKAQYDKEYENKLKELLRCQERQLLALRQSPVLLQLENANEEVRILQQNLEENQTALQQEMKEYEKESQERMQTFVALVVKIGELHNRRAELASMRIRLGQESEESVSLMKERPDGIASREKTDQVNASEDSVAGISLNLVNNADEDFRSIEDIFKNPNDFPEILRKIGSTWKYEPALKNINDSSDLQNSGTKDSGKETMRASKRKHRRSPSPMKRKKPADVAKQPRVQSRVQLAAEGGVMDGKENDSPPNRENNKEVQEVMSARKTKGSVELLPAKQNLPSAVQQTPTVTRIPIKEKSLTNRVPSPKSKDFTQTGSSIKEIEQNSKQASIIKQEKRAKTRAQARQTDVCSSKKNPSTPADTLEALPIPSEKEQPSKEPHVLEAAKSSSRKGRRDSTSMRESSKHKSPLKPEKNASGSKQNKQTQPTANSGDKANETLEPSVEASSSHGSFDFGVHRTSSSEFDVNFSPVNLDTSFGDDDAGVGDLDFLMSDGPAAATGSKKEQKAKKGKEADSFDFDFDFEG